VVPQAVVTSFQDFCIWIHSCPVGGIRGEQKGGEGRGEVGGDKK